MSPIAGERDNLILNAVPRFAVARDKALILDADGSQFKVVATSTNTAEPAEIHFTAKPINMGDAIAAFSTSDGSTLTVVGNTATLAYVNMASPETTVTATILYEGRTYTSSKITTRVYDGATGAPGANGAPGTPGANGAPGSDGQNIGRVSIYQRSDSSIAPPLPTANATYTYATGAVSGLNNGWSAVVPVSGGFYLYTSSAPVNGTGATRAIGPSEWQTAALLAQNGAVGADGIPGNSARIAYSKTALTSLSASPATISTSGPSSYPPAGTWGADTNWVGSPPLFGAGENLFRSDGVYSPATGVTTWSAPYLNALKVGKLSAISADLGSILSGDIYGTVLHGGTGYPTGAYAWPTNTQGGFHLSEQGLLIGNFNAGRYVQIDATGNFYAPKFQIVNGVATFAGNVNTGTGTGFRIEMGPDDPVYAMWAGSGSKTDTNAIFYLKRSGAGYFGGSLSAGTLRTAVTNPSLDANVELIDGPFGTNGGTITVVCSYDYNEYTGRDGGTYSTSGPETSVTIRLYQKIGDNPETLVQTFTAGGSTTLLNSQDPTDQSFYQRTAGGSFTYTDNVGGTANRRYRAVMSDRNFKTVTFNPTGPGLGNTTSQIRQTLTIVTTE